MNNYQTVSVEHIRSQYIPHEVSKLDELKALDKKVKRPARIFAYTFGTIGSLVLGTGMCFAMKVIGDLMIPGIVIGLVVIGMVSVTYALYKKILNTRRARYASQILALSDELLHTEA